MINVKDSMISLLFYAGLNSQGTVSIDKSVDKTTSARFDGKSDSLGSFSLLVEGRYHSMILIMIRCW